MRGEHEERFFERVAQAGGGDLVLLHRLEQRGLGLGRRAVDFVGQDHVGENGAAHEHHLPPSGRFLEDFRAGDVGRHQVGRELDALELEMEDLGNGFDEQRLGQARRAGDQTMAAGEERDQDLLDDLLLPDDDLGQFGFDLRAAGGQAFDGFAFGLAAVQGAASRCVFSESAH